MYFSDGQKGPNPKRTSVRRSLRPANFRGVSRAVIILGLVSCATDISSEMVSTILPLYLFVSLGLSPLQFGAIDGLYQGGSALVRAFSGLVSDRLRRHKEVAAMGYGLSAVARLALVVAGASPAAVTAMVGVDRMGKGIRTAPRDALISLNTSPQLLGRAFGVHRAMDTCGAMIGPLLAFALLWLAPGRYDTVFVVSLAFAIAGFAVLVLFVRNPTSDTVPTPERLDVEQTRDHRASVRSLMRNPQFLGLIGGVSLLSLLTVSDAFVYLVLQRRLEFDARFLPLLYVGTAASFMVLAAPFGRLADRVGRLKIFGSGYVALLLVYLTMFSTSGGIAILVFDLVVLGAYYAATDGVLMAIVSAMSEASIRSSAIGLASTAINVAKLGSSILFGALWAWQGLDVALAVFGAGLALSLLVAGAFLRRATIKTEA